MNNRTETKAGGVLDRRERRRAQWALVLLENVRAGVRAGTPADRLTGRWFRKHRACGSRDRRALSEAVFSYFRWYGWVGKASTPAKACMASVWLEADGDNSFLRALAAEADWKEPLPMPPQGRSLAEKGAAVTHLLGCSCRPEDLVPDWFPEALASPDAWAGEPGGHLIRCIEAFQQRPPTWVRVPTALDFDETRQALEAAGHATQTHPALPRALALDRPLAASWLHASGKVPLQIQDLASQTVVKACSAAAGERWWDVCAGAGGKARVLLEEVQAAGYVLATDIRVEALTEMHRRKTAIGGGSFGMLRLDAMREKPPEAPYDGVLLDAPCSGVGTWARNPDARWRTSEGFVRRCAQRQQRLLQNAAHAVRPGGRLVYAVCTLTRAETIDVVETFLGQHAGFEPESFEHPLEGHACTGSCWIAPWRHACNGMFLARLRRTP